MSTKADPKRKPDPNLDQTADEREDPSTVAETEESIEQSAQTDDNKILEQMLHADDSLNKPTDPDASAAVGFNDTPSPHDERQPDSPALDAE